MIDWLINFSAGWVTDLLAQTLQKKTPKKPIPPPSPPKKTRNTSCALRSSRSGLFVFLLRRLNKRAFHPPGNRAGAAAADPKANEGEAKACDASMPKKQGAACTSANLDGSTQGRKYVEQAARPGGQLNLRLPRTDILRAESRVASHKFQGATFAAWFQVRFGSPSSQVATCQCK